MTESTDPTALFVAARDVLLENREDPERARALFRWPRPERFNWAIDWFDVLARDNRGPALTVVDGAASRTVSYAELAERSDRVANWMLGTLGVRRGDRVLVMLDNQEAVWEVTLAAMKVGAVLLPTFTSATVSDLVERVERGAVSVVVTSPAYTDRFDLDAAGLIGVCVGERVPGWACWADASVAPARFLPEAPTRADDPLFLYFTSGTTSRPKLVSHTHVSYPIGHLSGMYWNGVQPGDVHFNVSAPGWAKHAWSSFFVPLNAGAAVVSAAMGSTSAARDVLDVLVDHRVSTFCAPPTVWRGLVQEDLSRWPVGLREVGSVGEPLNPEVVDHVRDVWGVTVRDGYGQTETTAQIGNTPGQPVRPGSLGRPLPGYDIALLDADMRPAPEGEICVDMSSRPVGVMPGYVDAAEKNAATFAGGWYHTGDLARRDEDGYIYYVGRTDDVFKSYDYRISPFELESVLLEHDAVAEAAVVPAPDPIGLSVPKAFVTLGAAYDQGAEVARDILAHTRSRLARHQWLRGVEFSDLPKTSSGKIRRAELRGRDGADTTAVEYVAEELLHGRS